MAVSKEMEKLVKAAEAAGWRIKQLGERGWQIFPPNPEHSPVVLHRTPSDNRAPRNAAARLRKRGLNV